MTDAELEQILDVPFTFSINCASGLLSRCECWRCRKNRGEPVTEETEALAKRMSDEARERKCEHREIQRSPE